MRCVTRARVVVSSVDSMEPGVREEAADTYLHDLVGARAQVATMVLHLGLQAGELRKIEMAERVSKAFFAYMATESAPFLCHACDSRSKLGAHVMHGYPGLRNSVAPYPRDGEAGCSLVCGQSRAFCLGWGVLEEILPKITVISDNIAISTLLTDQSNNHHTYTTIMISSVK